VLLSPDENENLKEDEKEFAEIDYKDARERLEQKNAAQTNNKKFDESLLAREAFQPIQLPADIFGLNSNSNDNDDNDYVEMEEKSNMSDESNEIDDETIEIPTLPRASNVNNNTRHLPSQKVLPMETIDLTDS
jgi:hypothetical protein